MTDHAREAAEAIAEMAIDVSDGVTLDNDQAAVRAGALPLVQHAIDAATRDKDAEIERLTQRVRELEATQAKGG